jgi:SAM-dependent methyltransferase
VNEAELERLRRAYRERDAAAAGPYRWDNPGYVAYMQNVERAVLRALFDAGVHLSGARVLDVGSGSGYFLHRLEEYGAGECHGIDLMPERIEEGTKRYPTLHLRVGNAAELPFGDGEFDLVTQFTCLSSILDDELRLAAAGEMQRVGTGGWILSLDMRTIRPLALRSRRGTPTVGLDEPELRRLFGEPAILRRTALRFDLAELVHGRPVPVALLGALPTLRSHFLGLWRVPAAQNER